jgi:ABC-type polysaccharide/polyol phosphate transport system ATPase subunit
MSSPVVSCSGVSKTFTQSVYPTSMLQDRLLRPLLHGGTWSKTALKNVTLSVSAGGWLGIYGPNGSGKTTLLKVLAGLLPADAGVLSVLGKLSCFFELGVGFHQERSAEENLYLHGLIHGLSPEEIRSHTLEIIRRAGVESHAPLPLKYYSTGMRMRLAFIAAMRVHADVLFLDEVLAVGDKQFRDVCAEEFQNVRSSGKTVLLVSHSLPELKELCDEILFLDHGAVVRSEKIRR